MTPLPPHTSSGSTAILLKSFWLGLWCLVLTVSLCLFGLRHWPGDRLLIVRLINYATPWLLILLLPALTLAGATQRKALFVACLLPTLFIVLTHLTLFMPKSSSAGGDSDLRVMSFNVWSHNRNMDAVAALVLTVKPDILLVQELKSVNFERLATLVAPLYPDREHNMVYDRVSQLATFSRFPLKASQLPSIRSVQRTLVETDDEMITVLNAHFLRTVLRRRSDWQRLHGQVQALTTTVVSKADGPLVLGGDFNTTDQTETYGLIARQLRDAYRESGWGFGFTFPSGQRKYRGMIPVPPMVRIDHLFYSHHFAATYAKTLTDSAGSDHLPVVAGLALRRTKE